MNSAFRFKSMYGPVLVFLLTVIPCLSFASGLRIEPQGARAMGMGNAFVATADDPSAIHYNPAGLVGQKSPALYLGATAISPSTTFENTAGAKDETEDQTFLPPHLYALYPYRNITLGLGVNAPFGLGTKWSETGLTRYLATESEIEIININPSVAIKVRPWLFLGGGVNYMRSKVVMKKMVDQALVGGSDAPFGLEGDGDGWGYNMGVIIITDELFRFGISYRSAVKVDYKGSASLDNIAPAIQSLFGGASFRTDASTSIKFPDVLTIGAAFKPSEKVTLGLDFERTGWSSYDRVDVDLENEVAPAGFNDSSDVKGWNDVWAVKTGVEYQATENIAVRGGYAYQNNPAPDSTFDPRLPDSDQHDFSLGIGFRADSFTVDLAYTAAYYIDRKTEKAELNGEYESFGHYAGLSVGYVF